MIQEQTLPLKARPVTDSDIAFVFNSWLKSYRSTGTLCKKVVNTVYYENHHKILQKIMQRATCIVACDPEDPGKIYGYIVGEYISNVFVLHYVYVKHTFRKFGIGTYLLNQFKLTPGAKCYTHQTDTAERLAGKYGMMYHPYVILVNYEPPVPLKADDSIDAIDSTEA